MSGAGVLGGAGPVTSVAVVGLGLIGGSIARALAGQGLAVSGYDAAPGTRQAAAAEGIQVAGDVAELCAAAPDLLVLAVPLRAMRATAGAVARCLCPGTLVTDVGSVKAAVREEMIAAGLRGRYVGAHPMFGTQYAGFAASDPAAAMGVAWALTLDDGAGADQVRAVLGLVTGALRGRVFVLADDVHDEAVALISHVPHVLATELLSLVAAAPVRNVALALAAGSFRDGTRVARTDPRRTEAMVAGNAPWVASTLRLVIRDLEQLVEALETNVAVSDFFDRPGSVRGAGSWVAGTPFTQALVGNWRAELMAAGARGCAVVGVDWVSGDLLLVR